MTKEEALLRLSVVPPCSELSFWTIMMAEDDGTMWFLRQDASYTSAVQRYGVFEPCRWDAPEISMISFCGRENAEEICSKWNRLAEKDGEDKTFVVVKAVKKLELA